MSPRHNLSHRGGTSPTEDASKVSIHMGSIDGPCGDDAAVGATVGMESGNGNTAPAAASDEAVTAVNGAVLAPSDVDTDTLSLGAVQTSPDGEEFVSM